MQLYEIPFLIEEIPYIDKSQWESTRILALIIAQKWVKKKLKLKDIFELPWDHEHSYELSDEELEQNKQLQKNMEDYLNNQNKQIKE